MDPNCFWVCTTRPLGEQDGQVSKKSGGNKTGKFQKNLTSGLRGDVVTRKSLRTYGRDVRSHDGH